MIQVIDYLKIANKLNEIILYSSVGGIFLLWMCWKQLQKIIKNIIFFLLFISEIDIIATRW